MGGRRKLKGIVRTLAAVLVSRNNDLHGYWAPGVLYLQTLEFGHGVTFDLLAGTASPATPSTVCALETYIRQLHLRLEQSGLTLDALSAANISFSFGIKPANGSMGAALGDRFDCTVALVSDTGLSYSSTASSICRPHDPTRESRRAKF
jgi:hypothetical protein